MEYTEGKWEVRQTNGEILVGNNIMAIAKMKEYSLNDNAVANAHRIVACVNACEGIETDELNVGNLKELFDMYGKGIVDLKKHLDQSEKVKGELLRALQGINFHWNQGNFSRDGHLWDAMKQAIKLAEEGSEE